MMKHQYKTYLFKVLDLLPSSLGYFLYHQLQNRFSRSSFDQKLKSNEASLAVIQRILAKGGLTLENKNVVELGSGWVPIMPYLLKYECRAATVDTYDINEHFKPSEIESLNKVFAARFDIASGSFSGKYNLASGIRYFPQTDIRAADLKNTDIILSRFVLEHVPPQAIADMHLDFAKDLPRGSHVLHLISPSDHRAYDDPSLSLYDFLQYSAAEWDSIQTKFDYHNRLRLPQYLALFNNDFEVLHVEYDSCKPGTDAYTKFKALTIHTDYSSFSDEELTAGSINILLRKR